MSFVRGGIQATLACLLVMGQCLNSSGAERPPAKVVFAAASPILTGFCNVTAGKYLGYYAEEGIDAEFLNTTGVSEVIGGLATGHLQIGMITPDPILQGAAEGKDFRLALVYNLIRGFPNRIAVKPDSPIRTMSDLRGKRIGVLSMGHVSYFYPRQILRQMGMDPDRDAEFVALGGGGAPMGYALETGRVDAISSFDFSLVLVESLGFKLRYIPQPEFIEKLAAGTMLGVGRDYFRSNRELMGRYLRALSKGYVWYLTNPEACVRIHWKLYPESRPKGVAEAVALRDSVRQVTVRAPLYRRDRGVIQKYGAFSPPDWEAYAKFIGLEGKVEVGKLYTNELIDMANNFDEKKIEEEARSFDLNRLK